MLFIYSTKDNIYLYQVFKIFLLDFLLLINGNQSYEMDYFNSMIYNQKIYCKIFE